MNEVTQIKIGIVNCVTGKVIREKTVDPESAFQEAEKISRWFDKQDTFFSKAIWEHWETLGTLSKFRALTKENSRSDLAVESIAVFKGRGTRGEEHEFFIQRV